MKKILLLGFICLTTHPSSSMEVCDKVPNFSVILPLNIEDARCVAKQICTKISNETEIYEERIAAAKETINQYVNVSYGDPPRHVYEAQNAAIEVFRIYISSQEALIDMRTTPTDGDTEVIFEK